MSDTHIDRRDLIKKAAVVGTVGWTAPLILGSVTSPAAAASPIGLGPLYLHNNGLQNNGTLETFQGTTLHQPELKKDGSNIASQTDSTKYLQWQAVAPPGGFVINGVVTLYIGTNGSNHGLRVALYDGPPSPPPLPVSSAGFTQIALTNASGFTGSAMRTVTFGSVNYTVSAGRHLRLKIVNHDDAPSNNDIDNVRWGNATWPSRLEIT